MVRTTISKEASKQQSRRWDSLSVAAVFWFAVLLIGQWAFFYYIVAFYGVSTFSGDMESWNRLAVFGRTPYVTGDVVGNLVYALHALAAGIIAFGGALQLIPKLRERMPQVHRWNGRVFLVTVIGLSLSGFFLVWVLDRSPSLTDAISTSVNGLLILSFAYLAFKAVRNGHIASHRRWAMRLYLVANAQWFLRIGFFAYFTGSKVAGYEISSLATTFWTFGCYLVPLGVLELYLRVSDRGGSTARAAMAGCLILVTVLMAAGIVPFSLFSHSLVIGADLDLSK